MVTPVSRDILIAETNARFWSQSGYRPGQKLDDKNPTDRAYMAVWNDVYRKVKAEADAGTLVTTYDHPEVAQNLADADVAHRAAGAHVDAAAAAPDAATAQDNIAAATTAHQISKQKSREAASKQPPTVDPQLVKDAGQEVAKNPPPPQAPSHEHIAHVHARDHALAHVLAVYAQAEAAKAPPTARPPDVSPVTVAPPPPGVAPPMAPPPIYLRPPMAPGERADHWYARRPPMVPPDRREHDRGARDRHERGEYRDRHARRMGPPPPGTAMPGAPGAAPGVPPGEPSPPPGGAPSAPETTAAPPPIEPPATEKPSGIGKYIAIGIAVIAGGGLIYYATTRKSSSRPPQRARTPKVILATSPISSPGRVSSGRQLALPPPRDLEPEA